MFQYVQITVYQTLFQITIYKTTKKNYFVVKVMIQYKSFCFVYFVVKVMIQYKSFWIVLSLYQTGTIYMVHRSSLQCS